MFYFKCKQFLLSFDAAAIIRAIAQVIVAAALLL